VARVTHAHVAALAHVSVAAVHSYFRTREDLVIETLAEVEASLLKIVTGAVREGISVRTALTEMVEGLDRAAREDSEFVKVWLDWSTGFRADVWPRYQLMQEQLLAGVRKVLAAGKRSGEISPRMNIRAAARLFVGGGHTVALTRFAGESQKEIDVLIDHLIRAVMSIGLEADGTAGSRRD
jgi:TetR/AcrR family hemagglutinin/protease transcriptional regulator